MLWKFARFAVFVGLVAYLLKDSYRPKVLIICILLSVIYVVLKWSYAYYGVIRNGLDAKGEMIYCNTLLNSKYINKKKNNVVRRTCFNINNIIEDINILTAKTQTQVNFALAAGSVGLSVLLFLIGALLPLDEDKGTDQVRDEQEIVVEKVPSYYSLRYGWVPEK